MKNSLFAIAALLAIPAAHAEITYPDQTHTDVVCHDTAHLGLGLSLEIVTGGFTGLTLANISDRGTKIGTIRVTESDANNVVKYTGENFSLEINSSDDVQDDGKRSHVYAEVDGRVFNQPLVCEFYAHTL